MNRWRLVSSLSALGAVATLSGCCNTYKKAVEMDVANLAETSRVFYQQCVATPCGGLTSELVSAHIIKDAALACLVDMDKGLSTPEKKSAACACSDGTDVGTCKAWLGVQ